MSKTPSDAAGAVMKHGDDNIAAVRPNPAVISQMAGKVSHDELCDTMHEQIQQDAKLENGLSSLSIKPSHLQDNRRAISNPN